MANEAVKTVFDDRVKDFIASAPGTGSTFTLDGSPPQGFITLGDADCKLATNDYVYYCAVDGALWEIGFGLVNTTAMTINRDLVLRSGNADAKENFTGTGGTVFLVAPGPWLDDVKEEYVLTGNTTGAATVDMTIHGITDFNLKEPETDSGYALDCKTVVRQTGGGTGTIGHMGWSHRTILIDNTGGTITERYDSGDVTELSGGLATTDFGVTATLDATYNRVKVRATGVSDKNLSFTCRMKVIRV